MSHITVTVNGRSYPVTCKAGQEQRIAQLARYVDSKVRGFAKELGPIGETRLLMLAALVIADELAEAHERSEPAAPGEDGALAEEVDNLARRIEAIAARLETSHI